MPERHHCPDCLEEWGDGPDWNILLEPMTISIRGGIVAARVAPDARLPVTIRRIYSTTVDNQTIIGFRIHRGSSWGTRFQVHGVPAAARGKPQIEVTCVIKRNRLYTVAATDLITGKQMDL